MVNKKRFILAPIPIILFLILLSVVYALVYGAVVSEILFIKILFLIITLFPLSWIYFVITNSIVKIMWNEIVMPQKYSMNPISFLLGISFLVALFKKRESINIKDIKSIDFVVGYNGSLESSHQPMTILMKNGQEHIFFMKLYSKKGVMWILKNLNELNPKINFSKYCKELIEAKSAFKLTDTEKADFRAKRKYIFIVFGLLILAALFIAYVQFSGEVRTEKFDINSIGTGYHNNPQIILYTNQGIEFRADYYEHSTIYGSVDEFVKALKQNQSLSYGVMITYKERLGLMRNIINATFSNGQTYRLGYG